LQLFEGEEGRRLRRVKKKKWDGAEAHQHWKNEVFPPTPWQGERSETVRNGAEKPVPLEERSGLPRFGRESTHPAVPVK
jgi:hypothetical protein